MTVVPEEPHPKHFQPWLPAMMLDTLRLAFDEIRRNLLRSFLTGLGIMLGVGAVIAMVGLGQGATASVESDLSGMGSNMLIITPGSQGGPGSRSPAPDFRNRDANAVGRLDHVAAVAPSVSTSAKVVRAQQQLDTTIRGSTAQWLEIQGWTVAEGRAPTEAEIRAGAAVCLLGATVRDELFGREAAVGGRVLVANTSCTVIGLLGAKGSNTMGMDQDDLVFMPLAAVQRRVIGTTGVTTIYVSVDDPANIDQVSTDIEKLLREQRHVAASADDNFSVHDTREMASMITGITGTLTAFLSAVAGVSLLVGGIGIMNIMLVSVTERTREIGIRMAIGAQERDVLTQFLVEAALLSTLGGILGVALGLLASFVGSRILGLPFIVEPLVVVVAVGFSGMVGLAFGWFPARRAARMEPIDALRHD